MALVNIIVRIDTNSNIVVHVEGDECYGEYSDLEGAVAEYSIDLICPEPKLQDTVEYEFPPQPIGEMNVVEKQ